MASTMQLKHHAKFHAAVLRNLFYDSSSSTSPASPSATLIQEEAASKVHIATPEGEEHIDELRMLNSHSGKEGVDIDGSCSLSRAQRKRLKLKRQKEIAIHARNNERGFIGPVWQAQSLPDCSGYTDDVQCFSPSSPLKILEESSPAISDGALGSKPLLSRVKRRRIAKKNCQTLPRNLAAPAFTADLKGSDIIIRQML